MVLNAALPLLLHNSQSAAVCLNTVHMNQPSHLRLAGRILTMPKVKFRGTKENLSILSTVKRPHCLQRGINRKINSNNIRLMKIFYNIKDEDLEKNLKQEYILESICTLFPPNSKQHDSRKHTYTQN